jgi:hypothetical protein
MFTLIHTKDKKVRWVGISSTAHRDEDKEIVSRAALKDAVIRMKARGEYGPLRFWHEPGLELGSTDFVELTDDGKYLIESGLIAPQYADKLKESLSKSAWQMSIGFRHPRSEPDEDKIFHTIDIFERSIVPYGKAANRLTSFGLSDSTSVKHLPGKHNQSDHGRTRGRGAGGATATFRNSILNNIIETTRQNTGMSVQIDSGNTPTTGYMVSRNPDDGMTEILSPEVFFGPQGRQAMVDFIMKHQNAMSGADTYLGLWYDKDGTGQVYLDISDNIRDRQTAIDTGRRNNQIAIWDVVGMDIIDTGGTGRADEKEKSRDTRRPDWFPWGQ